MRLSRLLAASTMLGGLLALPATSDAASIAASHSSIINTSYVDPTQGASLDSTVYFDNYSWRVAIC